MHIGRHVNSNLRYAHSLKAISNSSTIFNIQIMFDRVCARMPLGRIYQIRILLPISGQ